MDYPTLKRLSAKTDQQLHYILTDATAAWNETLGGRPETELKYLAEIIAVAHVLQTRALTRISE